jgi:hypothetical protein
MGKHSFAISAWMKRCPLTGRALSDDDVVGEIRRQVFDIPEPKLLKSN